MNSYFIYISFFWNYLWIIKYNFIIYKVRFYVDGVLEDSVRTLYINVDSSNDDNAIYAGNATDTTSDDYLGLAVFTTKNPINSITE